MIPKFPRLSSAEIVRTLHQHGFQDIRQKGSHLILFNPGSKKLVTVPVGKMDLPIGTAKAIFRSAGIEP